MNRATVMRGLKRAVLQQVPVAQRRHAAVLLVALEDQFGAVMEASVREAYLRGVTEERQRHEQANQRGFDLGYQHGLERAIGVVGQPARRLDDDVCTTPVA